MSSELTKIQFEIPGADWHPHRVESLWATPVGEGVFRLANSPFFTKGYSFLDEVFAEIDPETGVNVAKGMAKKSGHSTYLLWVAGGTDENSVFLEYWKPLEEIGCSFEGFDAKLLAVDIAAETDIYEAYRLMENGELAGVWDFQEQDVGHELRQSS